MNDEEFLSTITADDWIAQMLEDSSEDIFEDLGFDDASMGDLDLDYTTQSWVHLVCMRHSMRRDHCPLKSVSNGCNIWLTLNKNRGTLSINNSEIITLPKGYATQWMLGTICDTFDILKWVPYPNLQKYRDAYIIENADGVPPYTKNFSV